MKACDILKGKLKASDVLKASGTSEGVRKAWETRRSGLGKQFGETPRESARVVVEDSHPKAMLAKHAYFYHAALDKLNKPHREASGNNDPTDLLEGDPGNDHAKLTEEANYHMGQMIHWAGIHSQESSKAKASNTSPSDAVRARSASDIIYAGATAQFPVTASSKPWATGEPVEFMYMPAGKHTICAGFRSASIKLTVDVDPSDAARVLQGSLEQLRASQPKQMPFGCVEHEEKDASVWAKGFTAKEDGVYLCAEPSELGARHVNGRIHRSWSPSFLTDADYSKARLEDGTYVFPDGVRGSESNPAKITGCAFCLGTLTNKPAFREMSPVKAREAVRAVETTEQRSEAAKEGWENRFHSHHYGMLERLDKMNGPATPERDQLSKVAEATETLKRNAMFPSVTEGAHAQGAYAYRYLSYAASKGNEYAKTTLSLFHESDEAVAKMPKGKDAVGPRHWYKPSYWVGPSGQQIVGVVNHPETLEDWTKASDTSAATSPAPFDASALLDVARALRVAHWNADTSTTEHEALGELYDSWEDGMDQLVEAMCGKRGCKVAEESLGNSELAEQALAALAGVKVGLDCEADADLCNIVADMENSVNKGRYLLKANENGNMQAKDVLKASGTSEGAKKGWEHRGSWGTQEHLAAMDSHGDEISEKHGLSSGDPNQFEAHFASMKAHAASFGAKGGGGKGTNDEASKLHWEAAARHRKVGNEKIADLHRSLGDEHYNAHNASKGVQASNTDKTPTSTVRAVTAADILRHSALSGATAQPGGK